MDDIEYSYTKKLVRQLTKIDLDSYKEKQMRRRLTGFIERSGASNAAAYFNRAEQDQQMLDELKDFLTINVSSFFRDTNQFEKLQNNIIPELLNRSPRLNIWSAGCSIGAEPYTLAVIMMERAPKHNHRILATDIDTTIIGRAQAGGPYTPGDVKNVPSNLLAKYFRKADGFYWVTETVKERVNFQQHDLLSSPYGGEFDLILCRNVIIYFTDEAKDKIIRRFRNSLKDHGVLFLGGSEIVFRPAEVGMKILFPSFYRKAPPANSGELSGSQTTAPRTRTEE